MWVIDLFFLVTWINCRALEFNKFPFPLISIVDKSFHYLCLYQQIYVCQHFLLYVVSADLSTPPTACCFSSFINTSYSMLFQRIYQHLLYCRLFQLIYQHLLLYVVSAELSTPPTECCFG